MVFRRDRAPRAPPWKRSPSIPTVSKPTAGPPSIPRRFSPRSTTAARSSDYRQGDVVFLQASPADSVFYIQKGRIKIVVASKQGKEAVVAILGPGEFFGEGCLIGQPLRLSTARAMVESEVMRVTRRR